MKVSFEFTVTVTADVTPARKPPPAHDPDSSEYSDPGDGGEILDLAVKVDGLPEAVGSLIAQSLAESREIEGYLVELGDV